MDDAEPPQGAADRNANRAAARCTARVFIDCSGDGDLAAFAGAAFEKGDEAGNTLYPTMMFRVNGVDAARAGEAWRTIPALMEQAEKRGVEVSAQGRDRAAAETLQRMARQRHASEERRRPRGRRHRRRAN